MLLLRLIYKALFTHYFYEPFRKMVWHAIYSDRSLTTEQRRTIRDESLPDEWSWDVWDAARRHWNYRCAACGSDELYLQQDHLVPVAHRDCPGKVPSNLLPLCEACNKDKSATDFTTWYVRRFGTFPKKILKHIYVWQIYCLKKGWS